MRGRVVDAAAVVVCVGRGVKGGEGGVVVDLGGARSCVMSEAGTCVILRDSEVSQDRHLPPQYTMLSPVQILLHVPGP